MANLTFTRTTNTLRVEIEGIALVLKQGRESGRINEGYVIAPGYGMRDMYSVWSRDRVGVTSKEGKRNLRLLFNRLRQAAYEKSMGVV